MLIKPSITMQLAEAAICCSTILFVSNTIFRGSMTVVFADRTPSTNKSDLPAVPVTVGESSLIPAEADMETEDFAPLSQVLDLPGTLVRDVRVCTPAGGSYKDIASVTLTPNDGQSIFLQAKTTTRRVACPTPPPGEGGCENPTPITGNLMAATRIACPGVTIVTTSNHRGTDSADNSGLVQFARLLYHPKPSEIGRPVTCRLQVLAGSADGKGCLNFLAKNTSAPTYLRAVLRRGGVAWGTNLDEHNAEDNNGKSVTFIGPGLAPKTDGYPTGERSPDLGPSEFVLKGRRFNAHALAKSLDVFSDVQLTCESKLAVPCKVTAAVLVQQMKSPTSSDVCVTTRASKTAFIDRDSHHQKLHLKALDVPFNSACSGRSFIIKTQVTLERSGFPFIRGGPVVVEYGSHNDPVLSYSNGRSIAIVVQDFPIIKRP